MERLSKPSGADLIGILGIEKFPISPDVLDRQVVSWDARKNQPLTLRHFIASNAPASVRREFGIQRSRRLVRRIGELSGLEVKQVVTENLRRSILDAVLVPPVLRLEEVNPE